MNKQYLFILLVISIVFCSYISKKETGFDVLTAKELVQRSIAYHDPDGNWIRFKSDIQSTMNLWKSDGVKEKRTSQLFFDNAKGVFKIHSGRGDVKFKGEVSRDTCYNNPETRITKEQTIEFKRTLGCEGITFYKNYYSYLIGLPMKLSDPEAIINDTIFEREYAGVIYDVVKVNYKPIHKNPAWYFYFSKENQAFQLCKFTSPKDENKGGEYIIYNNEIDVQGMKLKAQQVWLYNKPGLDTLGVDNLQFVDN